MVELVVLALVVLLIAVVLWQRARRTNLQRRVRELELHPELGESPLVGHDRLNTRLDDPRIVREVGINVRGGKLY
jgi:hypothetical protein